jgi:stage V sporulation protein G
VEITEVRIKLMEDPNDRLQAFCSITFDGCFVIRDLKIIQGVKGSFVAMPSRKLTDRCVRCQYKNHLRAQFCNQCGVKLDEERATRDAEGRAKLYADIAHPINSRCRELIQGRVLEAFDRELVLAQQPDYVCTYDDYGEESYEDFEFEDIREDRRQPVCEERPAAVRNIRGEGDTRHRIEPGPQPPGSPHHPAGRSVANGQRERVPAAEGGDEHHRYTKAGEDDNFGAGLV